MVLLLIALACVDSDTGTGGEDTAGAAIEGGAPTVGRWYDAPTVVVCGHPWPNALPSVVGRELVSRWVSEAGRAYVVGVVDGTAEQCDGPVPVDSIRIRAGETAVAVETTAPEPGPLSPVRMVSADIQITGAESEREMLHLLGHAYGWGDVDEPASIMAHEGGGLRFDGLAQYWPLL